jgi:hypothetical protein
MSERDIDLTQFTKEFKRTEGLDRLQLEAQKRQVRGLVKSAEGREALRQELGYNFLFADDALRDGRPLISLLVPTRTVPASETTLAVDAMQKASRPYCILTPSPAVSSSVIHWSRNLLLQNLRKSGQPADYVLLMDDDMTPPEDAVVKMLAHDVDIVAGACTLRTDPPHPNFRHWVPEIFNWRTMFDWTTVDGRYMADGLVEVGGVGTAFMLVKTTVLDKIGEYYLSCRFEREQLGASADALRRIEDGRRKHAKESGNEWWFQFLPNPWGDGEFGEDLGFCFKARECGYKIYVDTSITPGHIGNYAFKIADYLSYQAECIARAQAGEKDVLHRGI